MRTIISSLFLILFLRVSLSAQGNDPIDRIFEKYSGMKGITAVSISSKMFSMFSEQDTVDKDFDELIKNLKSIRILSVEDSSLNITLNFYEELKKSLDFKVYNELMTVSDSRSTTKFLVKNNGNRIDELLVITGGRDGNAVISIKGEIDMKSISGLSKKMGVGNLGELEKLDGKQQKDRY